MFFNCICRNIVSITLIFSVMGALKGMETITSSSLLSAINPAIWVSINIKNGNEKWQLEIPDIGLFAEISNGTDADTLNKYIGHFTETNIVDGNVGLAAHNRGYKVNYFRNLKDIQIGSKIYYSYFDKKMVYCVDNIVIIDDTNWQYLEDTEENRITLITCIANKPQYRLCVQGINIGGNNEI